MVMQVMFAAISIPTQLLLSKAVLRLTSHWLLHLNCQASFTETPSHPEPLLANDNTFSQVVVASQHDLAPGFHQGCRHTSETATMPDRRDRAPPGCGRAAPFARSSSVKRVFPSQEF